MTLCPQVSTDTLTEVHDVDGMPFSGLVARVPEPRAVIVALHGGATTSAYYHSQVHPRASLLTAGAALGFTVIALDRPGYGASHGYASRIACPRARVEATFRAIDAFLDGTSRGAGVFLMAHSMGCVLATRMAASERGPELLGLEVAGTGRVPHPDTPFMASLVDPEVPAGHAGRPRRSALREALWKPDYLFPDGADTSMPIAPGPSFEGAEVKTWPAELPALAAEVLIPVHITLGEYERAWDSGPDALADLASLFTASPRVATAEQADAAHNLSLGWTALSYHLKVVSFAEECAIAHERILAESPLPPEADR